ncbi:NAD(P)/FAD-dependent oxidoreductase [Marinilactibacillus sp. Marseille-P9653]|uniref:NAD(P)/FAD-dependent oxidoreductase n=1 Tax=Marinilactibacillus sp. Marseille-P9653 TaxID=2866583 RepID=UPI001CE3F358|nr:NAD(P)/FAD-dependent oxidoreductase [Marinilactibacillus sp. Marseille-P9653]
MEKEKIYFDYVIVGGGIAAGNAVAGIREVDKAGTIGIISADSDRPYERPALSKKLWTDDTFTTDQIFYNVREEHQATLMLETEVTSIDKESHTVTTHNGDVFKYKKLLLVTGGEPQMIDGPEDDQVFAFRSFEDYTKLRSLSGDHQHVAVVGGSYIGTELAANLALNNTKVTLIYPQSTLGDNRFPEEIAKEYEQTYKDHGIEMISKTRAEKYTKEGDKLVLHLDNGNTVEADSIVLGLGVTPVLDLAKDAGLDIDDGVIVDEYLRTSDPDIYSAGDIASYPDPILGRQRIEHVDHARNSGTAVGKIMAGINKPYDHTPYFYSMIFDISWKAIGTLDLSLDLLIDEVDGGKVVYYLKEDKPVGILTWNVEPDLDKVRELIDNPPASSELLKGAVRNQED